MGDIWLHSLADWARQAVGTNNVTEEPGAYTRSRSSGGFTAGPWAIGIHHTASNATPTNDKNYMWYNASAKPIGNIMIDRTGHIWIGACGATNTQGKGPAQNCSLGTIPENRQNEFTLSIEACNAGTGEPWPEPQQDAYVNLCAVLVQKLGLQVSDVRAHFEMAPGRKYDPAGQSRYASGGNLWDMDAFRASVLLRKSQLNTPTPPPGDDDMAHLTLWTHKDQPGTWLIGAGTPVYMTPELNRHYLDLGVKKISEGGKAADDARASFVDLSGADV
jgi:hypothetical protein